MEVTRTRRWAVARLILGMLQIFGAVVSLVLLLQTGFNTVSVGSVVITGLLTTVSVLLFGSRRSANRHFQDERRERL